MRRIVLISVVLVVMVGFLLGEAMAQPKAPTGLRIPGECYLEIDNRGGSQAWDVFFNGETVSSGQAAADNRYFKSFSCPAKSFRVILRDPIAGKVLEREFKPNEKVSLNRFIWKLKQ